MDKKILTIVCVVMLVGAYFLYDYQNQRILEVNNTITEDSELGLGSELQIMGEEVMPFNTALENELKDYITTASEKLSEKEGAKRFYYITINKEKDVNYLILSTGYGYDKARIKSFGRADNKIVIYYGNPESVEQTLVDESKMTTTIDQLSFFADQENVEADKSTERKYKITEKDKLERISKGSI